MSTKSDFPLPAGISLLSGAARGEEDCEDQLTILYVPHSGIYKTPVRPEGVNGGPHGERQIKEINPLPLGKYHVPCRF